MLASGHHKLLEQLSWKISDKKEKITVDDVRDLVGMSEEKVSQVLDLINQREGSAIVQLIEELVGKGENIRSIFEGVLERLHGELLAKYGIGEQMTEDRKPKLKSEDLEFLIKKLNTALYEMKTAVIEQLPLELAVMEWIQDIKYQIHSTSSGQESNIKNTDQNLDRVESGEGEKDVGGSGGSVQDSPPWKGGVRGGLMGTGQQTGDVNQNTTGSRLTPPNPPLRKGGVKEIPLSKGGDETDNLLSKGEDKSGDGEMTLEVLQQRWNELLLALKPKNHSVQALLRSARPKTADGNRVVVEVWYPFHFDKLNSHIHKQIVEETICDVFGCGMIRVEYVLGERTPKDSDPNPYRSKSNGNMMSEDEVPDFYQLKSNKPMGASGVRDAGRNKYTVNKNKVSERLGKEEDEALIKFAEEIFGG